MRFVFPVHTTASGRLSQTDPVGGPVAGSSEPVSIHERFQQQGTMPILGLPVVWHLPGTQCQNLARQPLDSYPRQNQKTSIVDDPLQVAFPLLVIPPDPNVSSLYLPSRRCPQQTGQFSIAISHPIAQVRAEGHAASQIVMTFHLLPPQPALRRALHQGLFQRFAFPCRAFDWLRLAVWLGYIHALRPLAFCLPQSRQRHHSLGLESLQQLPTFVILQSAVWSLPFQ